jgi:hypothetical protein
MKVDLKSFLFGKAFMGIELFSIEDQDLLSTIEISKKNNDLSITKNETFNSLDHFFDTPKIELPCYIAINTNQVLFKEIETIDFNEMKILNKAYPNLKIEDFYYEILKLEKKAIIFICRKDYIDSLLEKFLKNKINVCGFNLGLSSIGNLLPFFNEDVFSTNNYTVDLKSIQKILTVDNNPKKSNYLINGLQLTNNNIVAFSTVLNPLLSIEKNAGNTNLKNNHFEDHFLQNSFFKKFSRTMVGFFLTILLINFFVFNHYFNKAEEVSNTLIINNVNVEKIKKLNEALKFKEALVLGLTKDESSKSSIILNNIAESVPQTILLTSLHFNPLLKKIKADAPITTIDKTIVLVGNSTSKENFSDWITRLENMDWIQQVSIVFYGNDNALEDTFEIKILLSDEN